MGYSFDLPVDQSQLQTMKWAPRCRENRDLLCFSLADSDFCAPPQLVRRLTERAAKPHYGYTYRPDSFYASVVNWYQRQAAWSIQPGWISKGYGIYPSICLMIQEFTQPGDGVIFQTPVHEVFWTVVQANGRRPVENPLLLTEGGYRIDFADFEAKIVENRVRLYMLCSPHNPVCRVWTREELLHLAEICLRHGVLIVSDEVYAPLVHPGVSFLPIASLSPEISAHTLTCFSPSKAFSLTGIKDSLVIAENPDCFQRYEQSLVRMNMNFGANLFGTVAIQCVLDECGGWLAQQLRYVLETRRQMEAYLAENLPEVRLMPAQATCFAWLDFRALGMEDQALERFLTDRAGVLLRPGYLMGPGGSGFMRMVLACPRETVMQGLRQICGALRAEGRRA